ncbi:glutamate--cysteine ligase [Nicoliella lavandulae]|uniref:Glutamate--cysteine ligase n=1 Tax=Nicoliella lavandulae TaxID=3082954 RepID=A0ABU8SM64_9LACO
MFNQIGKLIINHALVAQLADLTSGTEVERFRIDENGHISHHPYPTGIGDQSVNPWITNDYLQTMPEVISPPANNYLDTIHYAHTLTEVLRQHLAKGELLWPLSMPPVLPVLKDKSLLAKTNNPVKREYLKYLVDKYGISHGTPCGTHINISVNNKLVDQLASLLPVPLNNTANLRNHIYELSASGFMKYRWLLTYLFGASPVVEDNYFEHSDDDRPNYPIRSFRQSTYGFIRSFPVDYSNVKHYLDRIKLGLSDGELANEAEFHGPIRFKGDDIETNGVRYLELRMLDLDPFSETGIKLSTLMMVQLMMLYFVTTESTDDLNGIDTTVKSDDMNNLVACERPDNHCEYEEQAFEFLSKLADFVDMLDLGPEYSELVERFNNQISRPELTTGGRLLKYVEDGKLLNFGVKQAQKFQRANQLSDYHYDVFENNDGNLSVAELKQHLFKGTWQPR